MTRQPHASTPHAEGATMNYNIIEGNCLETLKRLPANSVQTCVTSPPYYGLRDYGHDGQIGLEESPDAYVAKLVDVFREVRRVLRDDGTLWLNLGDSYANTGMSDTSKVGGFTGDRIRRGVKGTMDSRPRKIPDGIKQKDLLGIPWMVAFALRADGWYLRSEIIWHKKAPMPESVTDRPTKAHEQLFLLAKSPHYYYDHIAIAEPLETPIHKPGNNFHAAKVAGPNDRNGHSQWDDTKERAWGNEAGRNKRSVWTLGPESYSGAHFATMPTKLIEPCILAGSKPGDTVLDPFSGAATTGLVALKHGRKYLGLELNAAYIELSHKRLLGVASQRTLFELNAAMQARGEGGA